MEDVWGRLATAGVAVEGPGADEGMRGGRECATGVPKEETETSLQGVVQI